MSAQASPSRGLLDSLRQLGGTLVGMAEARLELLGTEYEQEKGRVAGALMLGGVALLLLLAGVLTLTVLLVMMVQDQHRLVVLGGLALAYGGAGWWLLRLAARRLQGPEGGALALSVAELRRDRARFESAEP